MNKIFLGLAAVTIAFTACKKDETVTVTTTSTTSGTTTSQSCKFNFEGNFNYNSYFADGETTYDLSVKLRSDTKYDVIFTGRDRKDIIAKFEGVYDSSMDKTNPIETTSTLVLNDIAYKAKGWDYNIKGASITFRKNIEGRYEISLYGTLNSIAGTYNLKSNLWGHILGEPKPTLVCK